MRVTAESQRNDCVCCLYLFIYFFYHLNWFLKVQRWPPFLIWHLWGLLHSLSVEFFFCTLLPFLFLGLKMRRTRAQGTMIGQGKDMMYGQGTGGRSRNGCNDCWRSTRMRRIEDTDFCSAYFVFLKIVSFCVFKVIPTLKKKKKKKNREPTKAPLSLKVGPERFFYAWILYKCI